MAPPARLQSPAATPALVARATRRSPAGLSISRRAGRRDRSPAHPSSQCSGGRTNAGPIRPALGKGAPREGRPSPVLLLRPPAPAPGPRQPRLLPSPLCPPWLHPEGILPLSNIDSRALLSRLQAPAIFTIRIASLKVTINCTWPEVRRHYLLFRVWESDAQRAVLSGVTSSSRCTYICSYMFVQAPGSNWKCKYGDTEIHIILRVDHFN